MMKPGPVVRVDSVTEDRNVRTIAIDALPTLEVLRLLNDEDALVASSVRKALPVLAEAVDAAVVRYEAGGTIHYFGAGTSGRIATLDAAELPPTFSADPSRIVAHHAGGQDAIRRAVEAAEDDPALGASDASDVGPGDVAIGLTASGRTPYVWGALRASKKIGALTVLISSSLDGDATDAVDIHIGVDTGPEAIAGSTRLKAGTAQKLVLNGFSTALMIRVGKTYSNLMVDVAATNAKLRGRVLSILEEATGATEVECAVALEQADGDTKTALVSLLTNVDTAAAGAVLEASGNRVREAVASLSSDSRRTRSSSPRK
jgi:N-acetylmuramic acid 6-phosphate etherase